MIKVPVRCSRCDTVLFTIEVNPIWAGNTFTVTGRCPHCDGEGDEFIVKKHQPKIDLDFYCLLSKLRF